MKVLTVLIMAMLAGCATTATYTDAEMVQYDKHTHYSITESPGGFTVDIYYSRYQFIPESGVVAEACLRQAKAIAWEHAETLGQGIEPVNDQRVKLSTGRNGLSGITSCSASAVVNFKSGV